MVSIESYGCGHNDPPDPGDLEYDLRYLITRDPHIDPALRNMTGEDAAVQRRVFNTPGAAELVAAILKEVRAVYAKRGPATRVLFACQGGRHRSVVVANAIGLRLTALGIPNTVTHRHIDRPVLPSRKTRTLAA